MLNKRESNEITSYNISNLNYDNHLINAIEYLPDFLKDSDLVMDIMDCLNVLISKEMPIFEEINNAHDDVLYRNKAYYRLTYDAKIEIIKELGFSYLLDIFVLTSDQLSQLLIFFNLIYALKGKREGLDICLKTLGLNYTYQTWDEMNPKGQPFTASLNIIGNEYSASEVFTKIKNFIRSYMLPWINITIELTVQAPPTFIYPSGGTLMRYKTAKHFGTTRDAVEIAVYDSDPGYDRQYYGASVNTGPNQYIPEKRVDHLLSINPTPLDAKVIIDNEIGNAKEIEQGKLIRFSVEHDGYKSYTNHIVLTRDKTINVELQKF